ncbi:MAG: hypothetical protein ABIO63_08380 [Casimicrobiaceae bacterium]
MFLRINCDIGASKGLHFYAWTLVNGKLWVKNPGGDDVVSADRKPGAALASSLRHRF